jgi:hypothetical protein
MPVPITDLIVRQDGARKSKPIARDYIVGISASVVLECVMFRVNNGVSIWIPKSMLLEALEKYNQLESSLLEKLANDI